jgi:hypothetical protein
MYQKILLAVDGSEASKRAAEEAFRIAAWARARVPALYVVSKWGGAPYAGYYEPEALGTVLREDGRIALDEVRAAMAERGIPGDVEIDETQNAADDIPSCLERCIQGQTVDPVVMFRPVRCCLCARPASRSCRLGMVPTAKPDPRKGRSRYARAASQRSGTSR